MTENATVHPVIAVDAPPPPIAARPLELDPRVSLRPEPFGALAYHHTSRRLVFLKHPEIVRVVEALGQHATAGDALDACGIAPGRRPAFERALASLLEAEVLRDRPR